MWSGKKLVVDSDTHETFGFMEIELMAAFLIGAWIAGTLAFAFAALRQPQDGTSNLSWGGLLVGFWALFFGLRLTTASGLVSWAPYLDQWKVDIYELLFRLNQQELHWTDLFASHNEHRILFTKLITLALIPLNGEWDNRPLVVISLAIQAAAFAWFAISACRALTPWRGAVVAAMLGLLACLSCDWENFVSGFQSLFHVFALVTLLVLSTVSTARRSPSITGATLALTLALLVTLGSGFMSALAAACALMAAALVRREFTWRNTVFTVLCLAIVGLGAATRAHFTAHDFLHAKSAGAWGASFLAYASWPLPPYLWALGLLWLPWTALLVQMWRRRDASPLALLLFSLGLWTLWQAMALAWSRAGLLPLVSSRYTGLLMWAMLLNAAAFLYLLPQEKSRLRLTWRVLACGWLVLLASACLWRSQIIYRPMVQTFRSETIRQEEHFRKFMRTDDPLHIESYSMPEIPYPVPSDLVKWMRDPGVREALPAPLRRDYATRVPHANGAKPEAGWLTIVARTLLKRTPAIMIAIAGAVIVAWFWRRRLRELGNAGKPTSP